RFGDRRGIEGADSAQHLHSVLLPIDQRLRLADLRGIGDAALRLRDLLDTARRESVERLADEFAAEPGESGLQATSRVPRRYLDLARTQHRPGVEPRVHAHDGDAGGRVTGQQRTLYGGSAAPAWQQRGMDIDAAESRGCERGRR